MKFAIILSAVFLVAAAVGCLIGFFTFHYTYPL
jgi:hypothetical protein